MKRSVDYTTNFFNAAKGVLLGSLFFLHLSCNKYLDEKPDKTRAIPRTFSDCQALLDNYSMMNNNYPNAGEAATDNYYITYPSWQAQNDLVRDFYIWGSASEPEEADWAQPYRVIFVANQVLATLDKYGLEKENPQRYKELKGAALFFRGYTFYQMAQLFAPPYDAATAGEPWGIPLRLTPNVDEPSVHSTVEATYQQILSDLKTALSSLPTQVESKSRPNKAAAFGALARTYLAMRDYNNAGFYANSALQFNSNLLDYRQLDVTSPTPFARFNDEVVFHTTSLGSSTLLSPSFAYIDSTLYQSYAANDLRKGLFFKQETASSDRYFFKGSYDGIFNNAFFTGIANDELYLIRAESYARDNKKDLAMDDLNDLLARRWSTGFVRLTAANADEALGLILQERRKELLFRNLRWTDLRRLNKEDRFKVTLKRLLNGIEYTLPPNDLRYTLLIPRKLLAFTRMEQNLR